MTAGTTLNLTPFRKVLVANRGEIARRVMRTARRLGYGTVAVYSEADAHSLHVRDADQAVPIGGALPAQSYLRIEAIIAAALASGADAIHPGYGFLAENAAFAQACRDAGLVFIGPSPNAIRAMGDKARAKDIMQKAGVPCVPGHQGDQDEGVLSKAAQSIGFPVMIKAAAGGGGRGMRLVHEASAFADLLRSARSEANSAFGDPTVLLERAIIEPRHIEIQVFGDRYGNAIHLGERDCSVQRRHQKIIEEAPSPAVSEALRTRMGAVATRAVTALGYEGAGTLEFLLDRDGHFYFMEMNTRLQVEHPVTEAITGLDLVELQLRIASGEPLPLAQPDVRLSGHAIEVRLCAEDTARDFMPQSGRLALWQPSPDVRTEHALESGSDISPYYDSMVAKVISHGQSRDEARRQLIHGLDTMIALGVTTNQTFLRSCLANPAFIEGEATTAFIGQQASTLLQPLANEALPDAALAALLLYVTSRQAGAWQPGRALATSFAVPLRLEIGNARLDVEIQRQRDGAYSVTTGDVTIGLAIDALEPNAIRICTHGQLWHAHFARGTDALFILFEGRTIQARDLTFAPPERTAAQDGDGKLRAALNGRVVAVLVKPGDRVESGQPMLTLEAMKMEHVHLAPASGVVAAIHVVEGEQVTTSRIVAEVTAQPHAA